MKLKKLIKISQSKYNLKVFLGVKRFMFLEKTLKIILTITINQNSF